MCVCLWCVCAQLCSGVAAGPGSTDTGPRGWERSRSRAAPPGAGRREATLCGCDAGLSWELGLYRLPAPGLDLRVGRERSVGQCSSCQSMPFIGPGSLARAHLCPDPAGFQEPSGRKRGQGRGSRGAAGTRRKGTTLACLRTWLGPAGGAVEGVDVSASRPPGPERPRAPALTQSTGPPSLTH